MLSYNNFSWIYKAVPEGPPAGHPVGQPWQVAGGKWHAHAKPGDPSSPIIDVPAPASSEQSAPKREGFKGFDDPWKAMNPEDRKEANRLFKAAMKAFPSSPKQSMLREKLNALLAKYGIGKKEST
jgi:hypothetical protein